jgi:DNA replication protein DnaC
MNRILTLSAEPLRNGIKPAKVRNLNQVDARLRDILAGLCDGLVKWPLYIHGPPGTGKSCAALCIADRVPKAQFWSMPDLAAKVLRIHQGIEEWHDNGYGGKWTSEMWWGYIAKLPLLVLDDVGLREVNSDFQMETLFMALEAREGQPLICTSNLDEDEIESSYNARIRSRLCCGTVFKLGGADRRFDLSSSAA